MIRYVVAWTHDDAKEQAEKGELHDFEDALVKAKQLGSPWCVFSVDCVIDCKAVIKRLLKQLADLRENKDADERPFAELTQGERDLRLAEDELRKACAVGFGPRPFSQARAVGILREDRNRLRAAYTALLTERDGLRAEVGRHQREMDFLGLQLDHAWGNVSEADYEERAKFYLDARERNGGLPEPPLCPSCVTAEVERDETQKEVERLRAEVEQLRAALAMNTGERHGKKD